MRTRKIKNLAGLAALAMFLIPGQSFALNNADLNSLQTNTNSLPQAIDQAATVKDHGFIYEIAGYNNSAPINNVYYAAANSDGSLGQWQSTTSLPTAVVDPSAVVFNGYVYVMGGWNDNPNMGQSTYYNNVYAAPIEANGTLGSWQSMTALPYSENGGNAFAYDGYIYLLGGGNTNAYSAPIEANGTTGNWTTTTTLPDSLQYSSLVQSDGYVYEIGGSDGGATSTNAIYYAQVNNNGTLAAWQTSAQQLPTPYSFTTAATIGGYLYILGGYHSSTLYSTVYYGSLNFSNTKLINNANGSGLILINTAAGTNLTCGNSVSETSLAKQDSGYSYPIGLVNVCYTTDNSSDNVKLTFVTGLSPSQVIARDYNSVTSTYVTVPGATITQSSYNGQPALILTYSVAQGGGLDSSSINGQVIDPVGLAQVVATTTTATPDTGYGMPQATSPLVTLVGLGALISLGSGLVLIYKRKTQ